MSNYKQKYYKYKFKYLLTKPSVTTPHFRCATIGGATLETPGTTPGTTPATTTPGTTPGTTTTLGLSADEIIDNFYLCTQSRHKTPITDFLRPFGSFEELDERYKLHPALVKSIKDRQMKISNAIAGSSSSQYGVYFRLVKKKLVNDFEIKKSDDVEFTIGRSFIFNIRGFLDYIQKQKIPNVPLFYYSSRNSYGYEIYSDAFLTNQSDINSFLQNIGNTLSSSLYQHELVSRLPIPLSKDSGFIGVINHGILSFNHYDEEFKQQRIKEIIENDRTRCKKFKGDENECIKSQCYYHKDSGNCGPHFTLIRNWVE